MVGKEKLLYKINHLVYAARFSDAGQSQMLVRMLLHLQRKIHTRNLPKREFPLYMYVLQPEATIKTCCL